MNFRSRLQQLCGQSSPGHRILGGLRWLFVLVSHECQSTTETQHSLHSSCQNFLVRILWGLRCWTGDSLAVNTSVWWASVTASRTSWLMKLDIEKRYFSSSYSVTSPGDKITFKKWKNEGQESKKTDSWVKILEREELYYNTYSRIIRQNRCRQDDLRLERSILVKKWSRTLNITLLSIFIVGAWRLYKYAIGKSCYMNLTTFYEPFLKD